MAYDSALGMHPMGKRRCIPVEISFALVPNWKFAPTRPSSLNPSFSPSFRPSLGLLSRRVGLITACTKPNVQSTSFDLASAFPPGSVALVGAGPGASDLLTFRAARLISAADVVLHDRLGCAGALSHARPTTLILSVGKGRGVGTGSQGWICDELVRHAQAGKRVVRLKGGDPLTFGRGGEEAAHLRALGISVLVCPGVSSSAGAAAALQVPLTHYGVSAGIRLCTAHEVRGRFAGEIGHRETIVVYMGLREVAAVTAALISDGMPRDTPAVAVQNATMGSQKEVWSCVSELASDVKQAALESPTLFIIGACVAQGPGWVKWARNETFDDNSCAKNESFLKET